MDSVGQMLAEERRRQGRTLPDVEGATRIRARLLEALEHGHYDELPPSAYIKGYIQSYATYLRIPAQPLVERYADETRDKCEPVQLQPPKQVVARREHAHGTSVRSFVYVAGAVLGLSLVGWSGIRLFDRPAQPPPIPGSGTKSERRTTRPKPKAREIAPQPKPRTIPGPAYLLKVKVAADESSWLRVTVDGKTAFEGMMQADQEREWKVAQGAKLRIGRTSAVEVTKDGEAVPLKKGVIVSTLYLPASE